ncbi:helix-turn-helix domain-containing protein [Rhizobium leucaenae]|jgi:transcriptional regulator with XRE-family HTH domain|uniref:Transcriptional regulator with XRE-family HTH domain n=1 Tax=Rhizobium leucaenae TaxID=29450 RepID=A0A7W6ZXF2_9HYPH|nr:DNA-binding protein [Rhizobium leucaenae]MBB4570471.1 transcriptional regulator with XRE-family HTH domain [Rhizobium leucaenae]MBB6303373.1 transcriptional regulator with XRE-family HTH domain [Rhizobium leucaenae]
MITSAQLRGARAMLGLTTETLAAESNLSVTTIETLERDVSSADAKALVAARAALEARGISFLASGSDDAGGAGIRFKHWAEDGGIRPENLNATNDD